MPRYAYQDMILQVPESGFGHAVPEKDRVRPATTEDVEAMAALEMDIAAITREKDYRYLIDNREGFWDALVCSRGDGEIDGFIFSVNHAA